jgi:uncharacterized membrane protein
MSLTVEKIKNFEIPIYTNYLKYVETPSGSVYPEVNPTEIGTVKFATLATFFALLSGIAHAIVLLKKSRYIEDLRRGINFFRWYEYSISSSLMIILIAMLFGVYDLWSLVMMASVNACMNLFGLM